MEIKDFINKSISEKIDIAENIIYNLQKNDEIIFIEDIGCIVNYEGVLAEWFSEVIVNRNLLSKLTFCIVSKFRLFYFGETVLNKAKEKIFAMEIGELSKKERDGLLSRYLKFEEIELNSEEFHLISDLLSGYPEQVFYSDTLIKEKGFHYFKSHMDEIVEFNNQKASIILNYMDDNEEKKEFLALLSSIDYIGVKYIYDIVGKERKYENYLNEFISNAICDYVGVMKEYVKVNETIREYVIRSDFKISDEHKTKMEINLNDFIERIDTNEYDMPEFLFSLKEALLKGKKIEEKYLVPSLYLKTMNDFYNMRKNKEVIIFAEKALEKENFMDKRMVFEIRYLLCSALAKLREKRFLEEVQKISGADHYFLMGFYYRQIGIYNKALSQNNLSMEKRNNFSKAKREKVQIYISMQEFQSAKELAKENYLNYKNNPYHIQAYFSCLIKAERSKDNRITLEELLKSLNGLNSEVSKEMYLRCKAQFEAFYNDSEENALHYINSAIEINQNIQYARLVKFDICDRFNLIDEMKEILEFFKQPEYQNKYQANITCFSSIIIAKEKNVEDAVDYFSQHIKNYTDEAKDKFITRLNKYKENQ